MKYIFICNNGDEWTKEFDDKKKAIDTAEREWMSLSNRDKKKYESFLVIESANPDTEAENHFDGDIIIDFKTPLILRDKRDKSFELAGGIAEIKSYLGDVYAECLTAWDIERKLNEENAGLAGYYIEE